jgi:uncharacterized protein (TIGR02466 family)
MSQARSLFATPFVVDRLQSAEGLRLLSEAIEAERLRDPAGMQISNVGGWHSNTGMLEWGGEAARALAYKAMTMADQFTVDARSPQQNRFEWVPEMWANVSGKEHANQYHAHPGSYWSAVAYVDDGYDGSEEATLGGELQLLDPRMPMIRMTAPDLFLTDGQGSGQPNEYLHRPSTGEIVLFPSWLQHAVRPFHGSGTRISIAINLIAARKG